MLINLFPAAVHYQHHKQNPRSPWALRVHRKWSRQGSRASESWAGDVTSRSKLEAAAAKRGPEPSRGLDALWVSCWHGAVMSRKGRDCAVSVMCLLWSACSGWVTATVSDFPLPRRLGDLSCLHTVMPLPVLTSVSGEFWALSRTLPKSLECVSQPMPQKTEPHWSLLSKSPVFGGTRCLNKLAWKITKNEALSVNSLWLSAVPWAPRWGHTAPDKVLDDQNCLWSCFHLLHIPVSSLGSMDEAGQGEWFLRFTWDHACEGHRSEELKLEPCYTG